MSKKTITGIVLIAAATIAGVVFINRRATAKPKEFIPTHGNSINNPISINKYNPGNIRDSIDIFKGEIDSPESDFKSFSSMAYGYRAMIKILRTYYTKYSLTTLTEMITKYAPPSENNTENYIEYVAQNAPIDPNIDLGTILFSGYNNDLKNILTCMTWMEQGEDFVVTEEYIRDACKLI